MGMQNGQKMLAHLFLLSYFSVYVALEEKKVGVRPVLIMFVTRWILFIFTIPFCCSTDELQTRANFIQLMGRLKPLTTRDRLTTRLNYIGANLNSRKNIIVYSSITTNEECVLKRFDQLEERCEDLGRQVCKKGKIRTVLVILDHYHIKTTFGHFRPF